jgi:hypothetical protein
MMGFARKYVKRAGANALFVVCAMVGSSAAAEVYLVGDFDKTSPETFTYTEEKGSAFNANLSYKDPEKGNVAGIRFDIKPDGWGGWGASLKGGDFSGFRYLALDIKGEKGGETFDIGLRDLKGQEKKKPIVTYVDITPKWQRVFIPLADFAGVNLASLENMGLAFVGGTKGRIFFDNVVFEGDAEGDAGGNVVSKGVVDGFERSTPESAYRTFAGDVSRIDLSSSRLVYDGDYSMEIRYQLETQNLWGTWVSAVRVPARPLDWTGVAAVKLWVKGDGTDNVFRFRFTQADGQVWEYSDKKVLSTTRWTQVVMPIEAFKLFGQPPRGVPPALEGIKSYELAVVSLAAASNQTGGRTSAGRIWVDLLSVTGEKMQSGGIVPATGPAVPGGPATAGAPPPAGAPIPVGAGNVDFSLIAYTEYFHSPEEQSEVNSRVNLVTSGKLGLFSARVEFGTEPMEFGESSAYIGSTITVVENQYADVKNLSYQVMANNIHPNLSLITIGNQFIDYGTDVLAPVFGFRGISAQGDWKDLNYDAFALKHSQNSFTAGLRGTFFLPQWQLKYSGVYWEQTGKQPTGTEIVNGQLQMSRDTETVKTTRLAQDTVYNTTLLGRLFNDRIRLESTYGYNSYAQYAEADYSNPFQPIFSQTVDPAYRAGGSIWRSSLKSYSMVVPGMELRYAYRDIAEGYKPHYRQNPIYYDDTDSDQWGHNVQLIQRWGGWTGSGEYDDLQRHSNNEYFRHRTNWGIGYYGYRGVDINLTQEYRREIYKYTSDRSAFTTDVNYRNIITELYVRAQLSPRLAGWIKPRQERIYHPRENNNFTADSLHARLEFYIANNAKFFAEHKVSRFDNVANEPQGEPFDDNFSKVSLEVTF